MKPCKSCPFNRESLPGLWSPAHYLGIAYLSCADTAAMIRNRMGCHQWNGIVHPARRPEDTPLCGGWMRAARESLAIRLAIMSGSADPDEVFDEVEVMTPWEMLEVNGFDMTHIPPLKWEPWRPEHLERWPTQQDWENEVVGLYEGIQFDPKLAREYVKPGSPLDAGVTREEVVEFMGEEVAERYFGRAS
jgi:hypothetical protein